MAKQKTATADRPVTIKAHPTVPVKPFVFSRHNYLVLGAGLLLLATGFLLMTGGNQQPTEWDPEVIYGFRRITLSTMVVLIGFGVVMFSIFYNPKKKP